MRGLGATAALLLIGGGAVAPALAGSHACVLGESERAWTQRLLDRWQTANERDLARAPGALPWMVIVGVDCVYELAPRRPSTNPLRGESLSFEGREVPLEARPHDGSVTLPNGISARAVPQAFTALAADGKPFFVVAGLDLWRTDPRAAADPQLGDRIGGAALHELVHTLQLEAVFGALAELRAGEVLAGGIDDDVIETRFSGNERFAGAFRAERDAFERSFLAASQREARRFARRGLRLAEMRRRRYFRGPEAPYARVEELFLNMEGLAEWVRFRTARRGRFGGDTDRAVLDWQRGRRSSWSQDEGLLLALAAERLRPGSAARLLDPSVPSPFALLRDALGSETPTTRADPKIRIW